MLGCLKNYFVCVEERLEPTISDLIGRIDKALLEDDLEMSSLRQELHDRDAELSVIRKKMSDLQQEMDLTMSQLHQAQAASDAHCQSDLLKANEELQARTIALLADLI